MTDVQMDRTLSSEQKRIDFRPPEDLPAPLDRPTDACLFATALLTAAAKSAQQALQGSNGSAFTSEVSQHRDLPPCCRHMYCLRIVCVLFVWYNLTPIDKGQKESVYDIKQQKENAKVNHKATSRQLCLPAQQ